MSITITGLFNRREDVTRVISSLRSDLGIAEKDMSLMMSEQTHSRDFKNEPTTSHIETNTKAPEGFTTGALAGGGLGALAAGLAAVGSLAVPGVGLVAAGPLVAALAGAGAGAALGGLVGGLIGLGIPEHEAQKISEEIEQRGGVLVAIHAADNYQAERAIQILRDAGARDIQTPGYQPQVSKPVDSNLRPGI